MRQISSGGSVRRDREGPGRAGGPVRSGHPSSLVRKKRHSGRESGGAASNCRPQARAVVRGVNPVPDRRARPCPLEPAPHNRVVPPPLMSDSVRADTCRRRGSELPSAFASRMRMSGLSFGPRRRTSRDRRVRSRARAACDRHSSSTPPNASSGSCAPTQGKRRSQSLGGVNRASDPSVTRGPLSAFQPMTGHRRAARAGFFQAPRVGLEPTTLRLTAGCSAN
jgi:hypothetical protein